MTAWEGSTRRARLPHNWPKLRVQVMRRDQHTCQAVNEDGAPCGLKATDVDHIIAGDNHDLSNLQALCTWHHRQKTAAEANAAKIRIEPRSRKAEQHPGMLR